MRGYFLPCNVLQIGKWVAAHDLDSDLLVIVGRSWLGEENFATARSVRFPNLQLAGGRFRFSEVCALSSGPERGQMHRIGHDSTLGLLENES